ncbi:Uncharacterised protein [Mycobacteroides abscessus subsp. abscessus]|nr:Uncharacterised protein [Mycobacteroides abscessus subsp. abscessus]
MPKNNANTVRSTAAGRNGSGTIYPTAMPPDSGTASPSTLIVAIPASRCLSLSTSTCMPATPTNNTTASRHNPEMISEPAPAEGNSASLVSGNTLPNTVGPRRTPAAISPTILGSPILPATAPHARAATSKMTRSAKKIRDTSLDKAAAAVTTVLLTTGATSSRCFLRSPCPGWRGSLRGHRISRYRRRTWRLL